MTGECPILKTNFPKKRYAILCFDRSKSMVYISLYFVRPSFRAKIFARIKLIMYAGSDLFYMFIDVNDLNKNLLLIPVSVQTAFVTQFKTHSHL